MNIEAPVYDISFREDINAVIMKWEGYATSQQFKEGTELMLNTLIANKATKVIADIKDMTIIGREDQQWLEKNFIPRAISFGFHVLAIVKPQHYFNRVAVESISYKVDQEKLMITFFDNLEEAEKWIRLR